MIDRSAPRSLQSPGPACSLSYPSIIWVDPPLPYVISLTGTLVLLVFISITAGGKIGGSLSTVVEGPHTRRCPNNAQQGDS